MSMVARLIRRHPLVAYTVLACLFGWSLFIAAAFGLGSQPSNLPLGPVIAALVVTACQGRAALRAWGRRLVGWAASPWLYVVAVLAPIAIHLADVGLNHLAGAPLPTAEQWAQWPQIVTGFAIMIVMVGIGEEAGWSAFAAPALLDRHGLLVSWLILAAMRIGWHLPLMLNGEMPLVVGLLGNAGFQLVLLVLFQSARSRWSLAAVWHATLNAFGGGFFFTMVSGPDHERLGVLLGSAYAVLGAVCYLAWRRTSAMWAAVAREPRPEPVEVGTRT